MGGGCPFIAAAHRLRQLGEVLTTVRRPRDGFVVPKWGGCVARQLSGRGGFDGPFSAARYLKSNLKAPLPKPYCRLFLIEQMKRYFSTSLLRVKLSMTTTDRNSRRHKRLTSLRSLLLWTLP